MRGYFGIGIEGAKNTMNVGTLWRGASCFGASFIFTIGRRIKRQSSDTHNAAKHIPLHEYPNRESFFQNRPKNCQLVGIEVDGQNIVDFVHPERAIYVLGPEDGDLSPGIRNLCSYIISIPTKNCLNVSQAGSIVMFDRVQKAQRRKVVNHG